LYLDAYTSITLGYKRKAASTARLAYSTDPEDTAEFQWRLSRPLETLLLGLLAVPLSRASPRLGMHAKTVSALLVYALYYNLSAMAKAWVKEGMVGSVPGLWWPDALLAMLLLVLLLAPFRVRRPRSTKDRLSP
jgi:lipopolysaccharide export system permease protein